MRFIVIIFVLVYHVSNCQDINDAINYSFENQIGNSRFTSMSGAFGALGGNLSAISINPASSSVFEVSRFGGSIALKTLPRTTATWSITTCKTFGTTVRYRAVLGSTLI